MMKRRKPLITLAEIHLDKLDLTIRPRNALLRAGYTSVSQVKELVDTNQIESIYGLGLQGCDEVKQKVASFIDSQPSRGEQVQQTLFPLEIAVKENIRIPSDTLELLPIEITSHLYDPKVLAHIENGRFSSLGSIISFAQTVLKVTTNEITEALLKTLRVKQAVLTKKLKSGQLHSGVMNHDWTIEELLTSDLGEIKEQAKILDEITHILCFNSVADEIKSLLIGEDPRSLDIFLSHFGDQETLESIGDDLAITRERVRQIAKRTARKIWNKANSSSTVHIQSALLWAESLGTRLSLNLWEADLTKRGILGEFRGLTNVSPEKNDPLYILIAFLRSLAKIDIETVNIQIPSVLQHILSQPPDLSFEASRLIETTSSQLRRSIKRKITYVGGIHSSEILETLNIQPNDLRPIAEMLGLVEVTEGWYTVATCDSVSRFPIKTAGLKMMGVCGPLEFEVFLDGIRRYSSRFYQALAPSKVLRHILQGLGFELEDGLVSWSETPEDTLTEPEHAFLTSLKQYGRVVSFQEVVLTCSNLGIPLPTVTALLRYSPIVDKVETALYQLRGDKSTKDDIEEAKTRQLAVDRNPRVHYGTDGILRYRITLDSWAANGSVTLGNLEHLIPDLGDGWVIVCEGKECGVAKRDENFIWGLLSPFKVLGVHPGDRVELAFDAWGDPKIIVKQTNDE